MTTIEEKDEFTWDMVRGLPKLHWAVKNLGEDKVTMECKIGTGSIYRSIHKNVTEKFDKVKEHAHSPTYSHELPAFTKEEWLPPNLKEIFDGVLNFDKPTLIIQNKYAKEWGRPPSNYFGIDLLDKILSTYKEKYQIIYIRPKGKSRDYFEDDNTILDFKDYEFIRENHPEVITIYDLLEWHRRNPADLDFNTMQFAIHATSSKHLSVSGGNACLSAYFGGDLILFHSKCSPNRGIWDTNSWLKHLGNSKIHGVRTSEEITSKIEELWK